MPTLRPGRWVWLFQRGGTKWLGAAFGCQHRGKPRARDVCFTATARALPPSIATALLAFGAGAQPALDDTALAEGEAAEVLVDAKPETSAIDAGPLLLAEGSARRKRYAVRLSRPPTATTTVAVASDNPAVAASPRLLTFTAANWNAAQTLAATAAADLDAVDEAAVLTHTAGGAPEYAGASAALRVGARDAERAGEDYDADEDGLIEIASLAQLDAVRWDPDGDGVPDAGGYRRAFPGAAAGMGCPDGGDADELPDACGGYELARDLDFATDGDGDVDDPGARANWAPIGRYAAVFHGNGRTIANLTIDDSAGRAVGLFRWVSGGGRVEGLGLPNANVSARFERAAAGALAGRLAGGAVVASWSTGSVAADSPGGRGATAGGLVGQVFPGARLAASYSTATVSADGTAGGLVGGNDGAVVASYATGPVRALAGAERLGGLAGHHNSGRVTACWAAGKVDAAPGAGGLVGAASAGTTTASYWDVGTSGRSASGGGAGLATRALRAPTSATGAYAGWDSLDVDGDGDPSESPWHFGTASQYPRLRHGGLHPSRQNGDYDLDDDGLIEVRTLAQLDAMRWDLDGDGAPSPGNAAAYAEAFRNRAADMGCPAAAAGNGCVGYELANDLDFDTDGDGSTWTGAGDAQVADPDDAHYDGGAGWRPIGSRTARFDATFDGRGHVIANLFVRRGSHNVGFFAATGASARITAVGFRNLRVHGLGTVGGLVGQNQGRIAAAWTSGAVRGGAVVGGLAGSTQGAGSAIVASYSRAAVHADSQGAGLVGWHDGAASIRASYSTGAVVGGAGFSRGPGTVAASYWDTTSSGVADDGDSNPPEGRTSTELRTPTGYGGTGLYAAWDDQDVDGDGASGESTDDDAWHFGTSRQHPVLKFGGFDTAIQYNAIVPSFGARTATAPIVLHSGVSIQPFEGPAATGGGAILYAATGLPPGLSFDAEGNGACSAARTICGTATQAGTFTATIWAANLYGARVGLTFSFRVVDIEIDADPTTTGTVDPGPLALREIEDAQRYAVRLAAAPSAAVTVTIASADAGAVTIYDTNGRGGAWTTLSFTPQNWNVWQTVTARAVRDDDCWNETVALAHVASGGEYNGQSATLTTTVADDAVCGALDDPAPFIVDTVAGSGGHRQHRRFQWGTRPRQSAPSPGPRYRQRFQWGRRGHRSATQQSLRGCSGQCWQPLHR